MSAVKVTSAKQHELLHAHGPPADCCLCRVERTLAEAEAKATALEERLELALAELYAKGLAERVVVAELCDDYLDRSGGLLGRVRRRSRSTPH